MATRTDGVGTPGDSIQSMKKFTPGELKKLDPKKIKVFPHGEYMHKNTLSKLSHTSCVAMLVDIMQNAPKDINKILDQCLEKGIISKKEYDKIKDQLPKK